ncbi:MAG: PKD domain-containing protein [Paracoccaceae bacterium]
MTLRRWLLAVGLAALSAGQATAQSLAEAPASAAFNPLLVTYSTGAATAEGDPDYRQIVYIALPAEGRPRTLWIYDPNTTGAHDSAFAPNEESLTRFALFGGPSAYRGPIAREAVPAQLEMGDLIADRVFGQDPESDARWVAFAELVPGQGALFGDERVFRLQVEGLDGVEGNIFDLRLGDADGPDLAPAPATARLFAYDVSVRAATAETILEFPLTLPDWAERLRIENFDSGGGVLDLFGPYRTRRLNTSGNDLWQIDDVRLDPEEAGSPIAISFFGGRETPNDLSIAASAADAAGRERRLAIALPRDRIVANARPKAEALAVPTGCLTVGLDGRLSQDLEGARLRYRWDLGDGALGPADRRGAVAELRVASPGRYPVRLEVTDGTGRPNHAGAVELEVDVKGAPRPRIEVLTDVVAPGEPARLSAVGSEPAAGAGSETFLERFAWTVAGDRFEGEEIAPRLARPGLYDVTLEVTETGTHPCRSATARAAIRVNAPPVADPGPDRVLVAGEPARFDAGASRDPDGTLAHVAWEFGTGDRAEGAAVDYTYASPGRYRLTLAVTDDSGVANATARASAEIVVRPPENAPPEARIAAPAEVVAEVPMMLGAHRSGDPEGRLLAYRWRLPNASAEGRGLRRAFFAEGPARIALEVRDASGRPNDRAETETVLDVRRAANRPPRAVTGGDRRVRVGERVIFDGSGSWDPDGQVLGYRWRFGPEAEASSAVAVHAFQAPGRYEVALEVADNDRLAPRRDRTTLTVTVLPADR